MGLQNQRCPVCNSPAKVEASTTADNFYHYVECPACGNFLENFSQPDEGDVKPKDMDKLAAYLCYNRKGSSPYNISQENFRSYICAKEYFDGINKGENEIAWVTNQVVESWYPRAFNEKVDVFLLEIANRSAFFGDDVRIVREESVSITFSKRRKSDGECYTGVELIKQVECFLTYLETQDLIVNSLLGHPMAFVTPLIQLTAKGLQRVEELQKNIAENSKNVFVAMSFAKDAEKTREAIRVAVESCKLTPIFMDEVEHNHQIVPEMLYEIRQAKFVVAELTNHNNGAYYEAGYALGLGKDVIQVCQKDAFGKDGHFDVKQICTVLWDDYDDLTIRLQNRIKATIV